MGNDIISKTKSATKWSVITELAAKLVSPITSMILARLLTPSAFGIIVTALMVISFVEIFTDAGFQKYIIQHQFKSDSELYKSTTVAFWTNLIMSCIIWLVIIVFSIPIAKLVGSEGHADVIIISCACIPLAAFSSIQMAIFKRELDFKTLFRVRMAGIVTPLVVTIPLAYVTRSFWALVIGMLAREIVNVILLSLNCTWKPKLYYSFNCLKQMFSFTVWTLIESITIWLTGYVDIFLVSSILSSHYLGLYRTSMTTVNSILALIVSATTPILFSALSRLQYDKKEYEAMFYKYQKMVSVVLIPLGTIMYIFRDVVTEILLGSQWMETAYFIGIFSLLLPIKILISDYSSEVCRSLGRPMISVYRQLFMMIVVLIMVAISVKVDYKFLCQMRTLSMLGGILSGLVVLYMLVGFKPLLVIKNILPASVGAFIMISLSQILPITTNNILSFFCFGITFTLIYFLFIFLFPEERYLLVIFRRMVSRK